jgi:hypothetical protein
MNHGRRVVRGCVVRDQDLHVAHVLPGEGVQAEGQGGAAVEGRNADGELCGQGNSSSPIRYPKSAS